VITTRLISVYEPGVLCSGNFIDEVWLTNINASKNIPADWLFKCTLLVTVFNMAKIDLLYLFLEEVKHNQHQK
jgi:hypothetical protein